MSTSIPITPLPALLSNLFTIFSSSSLLISSLLYVTLYPTLYPLSTNFSSASSSILPIISPFFPPSITTFISLFPYSLSSMSIFLPAPFASTTQFPFPITKLVLLLLLSFITICPFLTTHSIKSSFPSISISSPTLPFFSFSTPFIILTVYSFSLSLSTSIYTILPVPVFSTPPSLVTT